MVFGVFICFFGLILFFLGLFLTCFVVSIWLNWVHVGRHDEKCKLWVWENIG